MLSINSQWILCPLCGNKTRNKIREDTVSVSYTHLSTDRLELAKLLNISDLQMSYITNVSAGQGLLKAVSYTHLALK